MRSSTSWSTTRALQSADKRLPANREGWRLTGRLSGDALEDVVDEGVEDRHRLVRDTRVGVDLLEDW